MSTITIKVKFISTRLFCFFFGHRIITTRNITHHFKEYKYTVCSLELTKDEKGNKTSLTPELKDINRTLEIFFYKKNIRDI
jgi:hypothetical protein